jgi:hypothetical protein
MSDIHQRTLPVRCITGCWFKEMPLEHHGECDDGEKFIAVIFFVIERWKETMRHIGDTLSPLTFELLLLATVALRG